MKSTIMTNFNIQSLNIQNEKYKVMLTEEQENDLLTALSKKHMVLTDATENEVVEANDFVMATLKSSNDRLNKSILPLTVGLNLFNEDIEKNMIGMKIAEVKTIQIQNDSVEIKINSIKKKKSSEINDELIKKENIENVNTVEEFKAHLLEKNRPMLKGAKSRELIKDVTNQILTEYTFNMDEEELANYIELKMQMVTKEAENSGMPLVEAIKIFIAKNPNLNEEEAIEFMKNVFIDEFKIYIAADTHCKNIGKVFNEDLYQKYLQDIKSKSNMTEDDFEDLVRRSPLDMYMKFLSKTQFENDLIDTIIK